MKIQDFVRKELAKLPPERGLNFQEDKAWIRCPKHAGGRENTPSMIINLDFAQNSKGQKINPGFATCFGCGFKASWNALAELLSLKTLGKEHFYQDEALDIFREEDKQHFFACDQVEEQPDAIPWPSHVPWRNISGETISEIQASMYFDQRIKQPKCLMPVSLNKEIVGYIHANTIPLSKLNYINSKGSWAKRLGLFPYDLVKRRLAKQGERILFLVEGPRDALNVIQYGYCCLALLGTSNSWSELKADLILSLEPDLVVLMLDSDEAGIKGAASIAKSLKDMVKLARFTFPNKSDGSKFDASDLSKRQLSKIYEHYSAKLK